VSHTNGQHARCRQLVRVLRLRRLVGMRDTVDLRVLAAELNVTTRTIRRDFAALIAAGERMPAFFSEYDITSHHAP